MFTITVISIQSRPSFTLAVSSAAGHREISREVARRFGFATVAPWGNSLCPMPHSWTGEKRS